MKQRRKSARARSSTQRSDTPPAPNDAGVSPSRAAAFDTLLRVYSGDAYASVLLAQLPSKNLSREDRSLASEITLGVLRWQKALDYFIEQYAGRRVDRLDLPVLVSLRIGLYQIRFLNRIPHSAAVNDSVKLVKRARTRSAAGLVNAVLRKAANNLDQQPGQTVADNGERLSIELSHPRLLLERWEQQFGRQEAIQLAAANNRPARIAFRLNTRREPAQEILARIRRKGVSVINSTIAPGAFVIESGPATAVVREADDGSVYLQDEASQLVSQLLDPKAGELILDLCAGPGSKTSHIAGLTDDGARIVACDLHPRRAATIATVCARLGLKSVDALSCDATRQLPFGSGVKFNRILIDAPCSGTGTLRRNPEIKWRLESGIGDRASQLRDHQPGGRASGTGVVAQVLRLAEIQSSLLKQAAHWLKTGGRLVYSTCSLEREEGEEIIEAFLREHPEFQKVMLKEPRFAVTQEGFVRTFPHRDDTDGFFIAVLTKG